MVTLNFNRIFKQFVWLSALNHKIECFLAKFDAIEVIYITNKLLTKCIILHVLRAVVVVVNKSFQ